VILFIISHRNAIPTNDNNERTFGPVVSISKFDGSETEAVRLANDSKYGLASSLYSQDLEKAKRIASKIHAGQVGINCYPLNHMNVACPWVGHSTYSLLNSCSGAAL